MLISYAIELNQLRKRSHALGFPYQAVHRVKVGLGEADKLYV